MLLREELGMRGREGEEVLEEEAFLICARRKEFRVEVGRRRR